MKTDINPEKIKEVLSRGVVGIIEREHLEKRLLAGERLKVYFGVDPTSSLIHLGHAVTLWKLRAFQELGCEVILLIGDFTARIGDPSGKDEARKPLTENEVKENMKTYKEQASKILNFSGKNKVQIKQNSHWLSKLCFAEILKLASTFTVQRMLERDMFQKRLSEEKPISVHEFMYPLMQGYDSVAMDVDLEIGGNDQMFNMLAGRTLQKIYHNKEKDILTVKLLAGSDGRKMSKTFNNFIPLTAQASEMFGKVMSIKDELMGDYFELCTQLSFSEIEKIKMDLANNNSNPRDLKIKLAVEIVKLYHGEKKAQLAKDEFENVFQKKALPSEIRECKMLEQECDIKDLLFRCQLVNSKGEAKRLVMGGAVEIDGVVQTDWQKQVKLVGDMVVKVGKHKFIKIKK